VEMHDFFLYSSIAILAMVMLCLVRVVKGPGILNRIIASNVIGTKTIAVILFIGFIFDRIDYFIDIAVVYALINFIGTLAFSKYFEGKGVEQKGR
jgi:multicomponent Na+:H+ antiporter subunit F